MDYYNSYIGGMNVAVTKLMVTTLSMVETYS